MAVCRSRLVAATSRDRLGVIEVAVDSFYLEGVAAQGQVLVFDAADIGVAPLVLVSLQAINIGHTVGLGGERTPLEFEGDQLVR